MQVAPEHANGDGAEAEAERNARAALEAEVRARGPPDAGMRARTFYPLFAAPGWHARLRAVAVLLAQQHSYIICFNIIGLCMFNSVCVI
eukprot:8515277-Pyramimonas_sp.AAC.1